MTLTINRFGRVTAAVLAVILLLSVTAWHAPLAHAADTVSLYHDTQYHYGKWSTGNLSADEGEGIAFCVEPSKETPPNGSYEYELLSVGNDLRKVMYYLVGGNGYDEITSKTLFADYNYIDIYVTSHVLLSWMWDGYKWSGDADEGVGSDFKELIESLYEEIETLPDPPAGFQAFIVAGENDLQTVVGCWPVKNVSVSFQKTSAIPAFSDGNTCYSLKGTGYKIYRTKEDAQKDRNAAGSISIREDGSSNELSLLPGDYYYRETAAGKGYALDKDVHSFQVEATEEMEQVIQVSDIPQYAPVDCLLLKKEADKEQGQTTGDAKLAGAEFTVKFYPAEKAAGEARYTWVFQSDEKGQVLFQDSYKRSGPALPKNDAGREVLPLGTLTVQETKAPEGYLINDKIWTLKITGEGSEEQVNTYQRPVIENEVIRGGVALTKYDRELDQNEPLGGAGLEGITFAITNESAQDVTVDGRSFAPGDVITELTTDASGNVQTENTCLPYGTYAVAEIKSNDSYLLTETGKKIFRIRDQEVIVKTGEDGALNFKDQVIRNDISFHKIEDGTNQRMGMVAFRLRLEETGEEHVIVTNKNGYYSSAKQHDKNTNANDSVLTDYQDGDVIPSASLDPGAGLWFCKGQKGSEASPDPSLGALPYGTYTLTELRCEANEGHELLKDIRFYVEEDKTETTLLSLGTLTNDRMQTPEIHTQALDKETGTHYVTAQKKMTVIDTVICKGLVPGTAYKITGTARDPETGEPLMDDHGKPIISTTEYTPDTPDGKVALAFEFDGESLAGKTIVFTESLLADEREVAVHADLKDEAQTVYVIKIGTKAHDEKNQSRMAGADQNVTITDEVLFEGLQEGKTYRIEGTLMDAATGKELLVSGKNVTVSKEITPVSTKGTAELSFSFDAGGLAGNTIVVFERVFENDELIAAHEDLTDTDQTIRFPALGTTAKDGGTDRDGNIRTVKDTVSYSNVIPGSKLVIRGTLMDKETGKPVLQAGKEVTAETVFTPESEDGKQEILFTFDETGHRGKELVAFERLYIDQPEDKNLVGTHEDLEDEAQTVLIPESIVPDQKETRTKTTVSRTVDVKHPKTGDERRLWLYSVLAACAAAGMIVTFKRKTGR